jgi:hypothetical protein
MLNSILKIICERITNEYPYFGSIRVNLIFHEGKFVKYEFEKSETTVLKTEKQ